jgi:hypothetical protein
VRASGARVGVALLDVGGAGGDQELLGLLELEPLVRGLDADEQAVVGDLGEAVEAEERVPDLRQLVGRSTCRRRW